jgi:P-type Cu+ transporter
MVVDPVCGVDLEEQQAGARAEHAGLTYYFCSETCRDEFEANPRGFALETGPSPAL